MANSWKCQALLAIQVILFVQSSVILVASGQDILRQRLMPQSQQQPQATQNQNSPDLSSFADIKLPPQLASLSPEQLLLLAKIRELQIGQQQQLQQKQNANQQATPRPTVTSTGQIPQPNSENSVSPATPAIVPIQNTTNNLHSNNQNNKNDKKIEDGSYKESESEMEGVVRPENDNNNQGANQGAPSGVAERNQAASASGNQQPQAPSFEVNWNKCPQLEPSESEKGKKTQVITKCLQNAPIPTNLTRENVESHREQIATCALKVEGWFDEQGSYKYDKAEAEIKAKRLESQIELQVLKFHVACKGEAQNKFPRNQHKLIEQVQFYQACMDYYISIVCEIEVSVDQ